MSFLLIGLLVLAGLPALVTGQEPAGQEPRATVSPAPKAIYLPLIQAQCAGTPLTPVLVSPLPDVLITAGETVTFEWTSPDGCVAGSRHYALQIATDLTFDIDKIIYGVGFKATETEEDYYHETSYSLVHPGPGVYYWRISAYNNLQQSDWSEPRRLTIASPPPNTQLLLNPSFEDLPAGIAPWQPLVTEMIYQPVNDPQLARDGQQYLAINRQNSVWGNKSIYQDIDQPQAGLTYHFAIWVRASAEAISAGKPRNGRIALWTHGGSAPREHATRNFQVNDTTWHCVETSLRVSQSDHLYLRAEAYLTSLDTFDTYFDEAVLRMDGQATCPLSPPVDGSTLVTHGQGFDTCAAPGVPQLAAWKQNSPYDYLGIYLGGANHYPPCEAYNQQYQTAAWFDVVAQQGWRFIPIWVGPQAPCSAYTIRLSQNLDTARSQGVAEAQQALQAAYALGLLSASRSKTIIYYDMEYYPVSDTSCHNAVSAFLEGWVSELQGRGQSAGIYGSAGAANSWYLLKHVPDSTWIPWYIRPGYDPGMSVSVANQQWLNEPYWNNHRLFQYSNSHNEGWGGVTLNIDNDTASGLVAMGGGESPSPRLQAMELLTPEQGWILVDGQLFWTVNGGEHWAEISPGSAFKIQAVFFLDTSHGWLISTNRGGERLYLSVTGDGARSWQTSLFQPGQNALSSQVYLHFVDPETGWLVLKLTTGPNFSEGLLFKTEDGGQSWVRLTIPLGEPVHFVDEEQGWTAGGPAGSELYLTLDGGQTWLPQSLPALPGEHSVYSLPVFDRSRNGAIAVTLTGPAQSQVGIYTTSDGGQHWQLAEKAALSQHLGLGAGAPVAIIDPQNWVIPARDLPQLDHLVALELATRQIGWAHTRESHCSAYCNTQDYLWRTQDGGQTWLPLKLPR